MTITPGAVSLAILVAARSSVFTFAGIVFAQTFKGGAGAVKPAADRSYRNSEPFRPVLVGPIGLKQQALRVREGWKQRVVAGLQGEITNFCFRLGLSCGSAWSASNLSILVISLTDEVELHENGWRQTKFRLAGFGGAQHEGRRNWQVFLRIDDGFHEGGSRRAQCRLDRGPYFVRFGTAKATAPHADAKAIKSIGAKSHPYPGLPSSFCSNFTSAKLHGQFMRNGHRRFDPQHGTPVFENRDALPACICKLGCDAIG